MSRLALLGYGARLALAGGRGTRIRLSLMAGGIAVGVAMLVGLGSVLPAATAHRERLGARGAVYDDAAPSTGAHVLSTSGRYRGGTLTTTTVYVDGPVHRLPAGVSRLPRPGEVLVSPALARVLRGPRAGELAPRVPGRVAGIIGDSGLQGPDELFAWVGVAANPDPQAQRANLGQGTAVRDFGHRVPTYGLLSDNDRIALGLAFVGLLVPVLVLIATFTRLSAAARDRRLAAIRLVGATRRETCWLAAAETGVAAAVGVPLGLAAFLALRGPVAGLMPVANGVFATDLLPSVPTLLVIAGGVPALAVATAVASLRRVVTSPLGVTRRSRAREVGWWRLAPLALGMLMLVAARIDDRAVLTGQPRGAVLLLGGATLSLVGLAIAAAAVAQLSGLLLRRYGPGTASQLAGRRLEADPAAAARVLTGAMLVVAVVGWLLGFLPLLAASSGGDEYDRRTHTLHPGTMTVAVTPEDMVETAAAVDGLERVPGVTAVATTRALTITPHVPHGPSPDANGAIVGDCHDLAAVLRRPLRGCGAAPAYRVITPLFTDNSRHPRPGETWQILTQDGKAAGAQLHIPAQLRTLRVPSGLGGLLYGSLLVDPALVPDLHVSGANDPTKQALLFIGTDGRDTTAELVRSALWRKLADQPMTMPEQKDAAVGSSTELYRRAALIGVLFALLAAALSFAVTTADALRERRRGLASLIALGTPIRVLRRSVLLQTAAPLLLNIGLATVTSAIATALYLGLDDLDGGVPTPLPWAGWTLMAAAAVAAVLVATTVSLPFVNAAARPEALRAD